MNKVALRAAMLALATNAPRDETRLALTNRTQEKRVGPARGTHVNPKRQAKKRIMRELGLSGRQWVKYRKALRRGRGPLSRAERRAQGLA